MNYSGQSPIPHFYLVARIVVFSIVVHIFHVLQLWPDPFGVYPDNFDDDPDGGLFPADGPGSFFEADPWIGLFLAVLGYVCVL